MIRSYIFGACGITTLCGIFLFVSYASAQYDANEVYRNCESTWKRCYGDEDDCIQHKNCTYVMAVIDNGTHFIAEIQNNCNVDYKNVFFGIGVHALDKREGRAQEYFCIPKLQDFKFFVFWGDERCPKHGTTQKKWGQIEKKRSTPCKDSPKIENVEEFVSKSMLVEDGIIPKTRLENKDYVVKEDGELFTSSGNQIQFSIITLFIFSIACIGIH